MANEPETAKVLLDSLCERPIAYHRIYARIAGSVSAGLLLSQIVYWWYAVGQREFYKKDNELREELALGPTEFKTAKSQLKKLRFIRITRKGIPAKTHYKIEKSAFLAQITCWAETYQLDGPDRAKCRGQTRPTITENPAENPREGKVKATPPDFESIAREKYTRAKSKVGHLPAEFFEWFEVEVLARWDKFETNPTTIRDWHNRLWAKYNKKVTILAVEQHRAQSDAWKPKFAKVVEIAKGLKRKIENQRKISERQAKEESTKVWPPAKKVSNMPPEELKEKYKNGKDAVRKIIRSLRPGVAEQCDSETIPA